MEQVKILVENTCIILDKLNTISEYAKAYNLLAYIDNFDLLLSKHQEDAESLTLEVTEAIKSDKYWIFDQLNSKALMLK